MEIRPTTSTGLPAQRPAGEAVPVATSGLARSAASATPVFTTDAVDQASAVQPQEQLQEAVKSVNSMMQSLSQNLEFSVDPDSNRTIVRVIDQQTNQVLRQMPSKEMLEIAKALDQLQGLLINQRA